MVSWYMISTIMFFNVLGEPLVTIPVLSTTHLFGETVIGLTQGGEVQLSLSTNTTIVIVETFNVLCETANGLNDSVVMAGAHLDSVPEGL